MLSIKLTPYVNDCISEKIAQPLMSQLVSAFLVFILCIIGISIITSSIANRINSRISRPTNMTLGLAFGFIKGFLLCSLVFTTIIAIFGETEDLSVKSGPQWLQQSETYKPLSFGAYLILPFVDSVIGKVNIDMINNPKEIEETTTNEEKSIEVENNKEEDEGYREDQINKMNQLIESMGRN